MEISQKEVAYLAHLARLELSDRELELFAEQLKEILAYVEKLKSVSIEGIPPTTHVLDLRNVFREDEVRPPLDQGQALSNAPDREGPFFRVPRIIEPTA
jgi:aspartyl-tRNA(Asn)/glutamyl-tRNA(Gln) amidotransferase subunit C